jgi:Putative MetA-pathway of phenol degradation
MKNLPFALTTFFALCFSLSHASADELPSGGKPDKRGYSLFRPVPQNLMRKMLTDRPNKTETPYTVDAGHYQFETDLVAFVTNTDKDEESHSTTFNNINLKVGLFDDLDLESIIESYVQETKTNKGKTEHHQGFGDVTLRLKWNAFGNSGGPIGLGFMPNVKFPTSNGTGINKFEGGLITMAVFAFPSDTSVGVEFGFTRASNENDEGHHNEFVASTTVSHDLVGALSGFAELFNQSSDEAGREWIATFDTGLTYKVSKDIQADAGINFGLTDAADDFNPFVGLTMRY